eukprot:gene3974-4227_t
MNFSDTGLDPRILRALSKQGLTTPTTVQAAAIPAALQGKDVLARARTGSGKTLAYLLPALHKTISGKGGRQPWQVLVLVPTRELCDQVAEEARAVVQHCGVPLTVSALQGDTPVAQRAAAASAGAVVVATPARIATAIKECWLQPAGGPGSAAEVSHYQLQCSAEDRRLVVLSLLKLGLLKKKVLIFANTVEGGVALRLFLESFGLRLGCLHAELPVNSRSHILASFNKGLFDFLIAKPPKDEEFGVTRGIDFKGVRSIVNYDVPDSVQGYVHRPLRPFHRLTMSAMEALRYRAEDVGRTITKAAVREARARELQRELLNSEKLSEYFQEHEAERALLKHDKPMHRKLTAIERRALTNPIKPSKAKVLAGVGGAALKAKVLGPTVAAMAANKHNVKKIRPTMGAGAKRRR